MNYKKHLIYIFRLCSIIAAATLISLWISSRGIGKENALMLFMVGVLMVSTVTSGYVYSIIASVGSVMIFNYFFTEPLHTFVIRSQNDVVLMAFFLLAALISSNLTLRFQNQVRVAKQNEQTARQLYAVSERFSQLAGKEAIVSQGEAFIRQYTGLDCEIFLDSEKRQLIRRDEDVFVILGMKDEVGLLRVQNHTLPLTLEQELIIKMATKHLGIALEREALHAQQETIKIAMEREHLRNSMLRSISHDLRTPLTGIAGASTLILESWENLDAENIKHLVGDINEQAAWLTKIVENILNMTRIESGALVIEKQEEVVDDIINEAMGHVQGLFTTRTVQCTLPPEVLTVNVDAKMVVQVLVNILDNAMKHTTDGGHIRVSVRKANYRVYFEIEDDGEGIDPVIMDTLFDEFVTYRGASSDGKKGMGLGLAICKAVVETHGGEIMAANKPEGGAVFSFYLPLTEEI